MDSLKGLLETPPKGFSKGVPGLHYESSDSKALRDRFTLVDEMTGQRIYIFPGPCLTVGRDSKQADWAVRFRNMSSVNKDRLMRLSRLHCKICFFQNAVILLDCSSGGSTINGTEVSKEKPVQLVNGDALALGDILTLRIRTQTFNGKVSAVVLSFADDSENPNLYVLMGERLDLAAAGTRLGCTLISNLGKLCFVSNGGSPTRLAGSELPLGTVSEWHRGSVIEQHDALIRMEPLIGCPACGQAGVPRPDTGVCSYCGKGIAG
jgi:hypothetical protein